MKKSKNHLKLSGTYIWECNKKKSFTNIKQKKIKIKKRKNRNLFNIHIRICKIIESKIKHARISKSLKNKKKRNNKKIKIKTASLEKTVW